MSAKIESTAQAIAILRSAIECLTDASEAEEAIQFLEADEASSRLVGRDVPPFVQIMTGAVGDEDSTDHELYALDKDGRMWWWASETINGLRIYGWRAFSTELIRPKVEKVRRENG